MVSLVWKVSVNNDLYIVKHANLVPVRPNICCSCYRVLHSSHVAHLQQALHVRLDDKLFKVVLYSIFTL